MVQTKQGKAASDDRHFIVEQQINLYRKLNEALFQQNKKEVLKLKSQIEKNETELNSEKFSAFWSEEKQRPISYTEYVIALEEEKKQTLFDIAEISGNGNYKPINQWTWGEIIDYIDRKNKQHESLKSKNNSNSDAESY